MLPYATGKSPGLPEAPQGKMPWAMEARAWSSQIMIEH
jgi:hypothetical protein